MKKKEIILNDIKEILTSSTINFCLLKDKTVLITGATGMLASYVVYTLLYLNECENYNINIVTIARNKEKCRSRFDKYIEKSYFTILEQDINQPITYDKTIDYVFHAASSANPYAIKHTPVDICLSNTIGTMNVLELCKNKKVKNILFTSTREVYGKIENSDRIFENTWGTFDPLDNRSCYPESKRMGETLCKSYAIQYGILFNVVRIAHSYGPNMLIENDGRILSDLIGDTIRKHDLILKSTGEAKRTFCYVSDAVSALFYVLLQGSKGMAYNVSNEQEEIAIKDLAELLIELSDNKEIKIEFQVEASSLYCQYDRVQLDNTLITKLGWKPNVTLKEGLTRTIQSFINK